MYEHHYAGKTGKFPFFMSRDHHAGKTSFRHARSHQGSLGYGLRDMDGERNPQRSRYPMKQHCFPENQHCRLKGVVISFIASQLIMLEIIPFLLFRASILRSPQAEWSLQCCAHHCLYRPDLVALPSWCRRRASEVHNRDYSMLFPRRKLTCVSLCNEF